MATQAAVHETEGGAKLDCIHCGLCLSVCPTYLKLGSEADSPRGRIYLIKAMQEGRVSSASPVFAEHMNLCLECRACETACPSGVQFSFMMNEARTNIRESCPPGIPGRLLRHVVFAWVLPGRHLLRWSFLFLRLYQQTGLQRLVRTSGILRLLPKPLKAMEELLPPIPPAFRRALPPTTATVGSAQTALFLGCVMPELFGPVHDSTVRVLQRQGVTVTAPANQTCCGALHLHDGESGTARNLARANIDAFEASGADRIVVNAAGCGAMLKEYGHLLADDEAYRERARAFSRRVRDIAEYLAEIGLNTEMGRIDLKVTYDDPCHLLHGQGIKASPRDLLKAVPGITLTELKEADRCCGSAGIYNLTHPEMAGRILEDKVSNILQTGAQAVATGNPGCLLQIERGLRARNSAVEVLHPVQILDRAYEAGPPPGKSRIISDPP